MLQRGCGRCTLPIIVNKDKAAVHVVILYVEPFGNPIDSHITASMWLVSSSDIEIWFIGVSERIADHLVILHDALIFPFNRTEASPPSKYPVLVGIQNEI